MEERKISSWSVTRFVLVYVQKSYFYPSEVWRFCPKLHFEKLIFESILWLQPDGDHIFPQSRIYFPYHKYKLKKEMKANYSETFIDIIVSVNRRKVTIDFRFFLLHTANISCFSIP